MNITLEKKTDVRALLTMTIEKADYSERVEKALKDFRKRANMPGFRPGQVPMGLLKKRFGHDITAEEVNKLIGENLNKYIRDNKVKALGEPMPNMELQKPIDFESEEAGNVYFDIALAPEFTVELGKEDVIDYYKIGVTDEMVQKQVEMYAARAGEYGKVDAYQKGDMTKGLLAELDAEGNTLEGGVQVEGAVMLPTYIKDEAEAAKFEGVTPNTVLTLNLHKAYNGSEIELSSLLKLSKEEAVTKTGDFSYQIDEITRHIPHAIDQELFDQTFGEGACASEDEFRGKIRGQLAQQFTSDANFKFLMDMRKYVEGKVGELHYDEEILKRYLAAANPDKDQKYIDENYEGGMKQLTWQLIKNQLTQTFEVKVDDGDILNAAKEATRVQFAQYGMANIADEILENYAKEQLKKREQVDQFVDRCIEDKIGAAVKAAVTLNEKEVSFDEFNKMFQ
ncbi:MAG: trigger factor [Bacteroidaceae bacterium]|nr:trigger factor [Bacteroidaceae bacterium]